MPEKNPERDVANDPLTTNATERRSAPADTAEPPWSAETGLRAQLRRQRTPLLVLGAVGLLVLGFAVGVLAGLPLRGGSEPEPGPVDIGFSQDMSAHHAQAVEMSGVALINSTDPDIRRLAYDILTTQQSQVGRMQGWLQLWGAPARGIDGYMGWMTEPRSGHEHGSPAAGHSAHTGPVATMPGMATPAELGELRRATGPAFDVLFLQLMLRHHEGGIPMLGYAIEHAETTAIRVLAQHMDATQRGESQLMTGMLTARGATPLPLE